ncbi:hypothetical protein GCM10018790_47800 [Kitasatospora xanthocidica]|uniref:T3SS effector HopA1 family protein n=1 Tax=Kitasatospora xanthocidica TaxID=83382 RepID=UPI00167BC650|nr:T3SS effector HopA1 family protein [Kitasatospora xanthocidica]GHF64457.1 hypothetical protein GCM10018790_47800 [Kitasatospora xanthocidica]
MLGQLQLARDVRDLIGRVTVAPGALTAETAGETYEEETSQALARRLGAALYQTLHTGRDKPLDGARRSFREPDFDALLNDATGPLSTPTSAQVLLAEEAHTLVLLDGLRVRVPHEKLAEQPDGSVKVLVPGARPGLSPGFFYVTSGHGAVIRSGPMLRLYARLDTPDVAPDVWRALMTFLGQVDTPWHAKISSSRLLYPRNDAVVVYLPRPSWRQARPIAEALQATGLLGRGTSPFTQPITESVGCAFEPDDPRPTRRDLSFGQHRTQVFADALIQHALLEDGEEEPVEEIVSAAFIDAGIDPAMPARNLTSPVVDVLRGY